MKRKLFAALLVCALALTGCGRRACYSEDANGQEFFNAKVLEIGENSVLVEPLEGEDELRSADQIWVSTDVVSAAGAPALAVGDEIRVVYDGVIAETYPAQVDGVFAIYLLDENGGVVLDVACEG